MAECPTTVTKSGVVVVRPKGRLTFGMAADLRNQLRGLVDDGSIRLVVDLSDVPSTDSSGLGVLIDGLKAARQAGGDLRIAGANDHVLAAIELTNLDRILKSFDTVDQAFDESLTGAADLG